MGFEAHEPMMETAKRVLIIGGGFSGMAVAMEFRKRGAAVDVAEISPQWSSYGAGITLGGATLRAMRTLGILDEFIRRGFAGDGLELLAPNGHPVGHVPTPRVAGPDVPGSAGIMRPVLAQIMSEATRKCGARVLLGCTFEKLEQRDDQVRVAFTNGDSGTYDLVVGADGLNSKVRGALFPQSPGPRYSGQGVWRAVLPRPAGLDSARMWVGGRVKPGVNPVSAAEMYLFITENRPNHGRLEPLQFPALMQAILQDFTDPMLTQIRESLGPTSQIVYRPLEVLLQPLPWHLNRIVLIGDAVHATTPHLASGACIGLEDAIVLAEEAGACDSLETALRAFERRRWERCRMVVQNSSRLGEIEVAGGDMQEHAGIMRESMMALAAPI